MVLVNCVPGHPVASHDVERNWAGNVTFAASRRHRPSSVGELQELVASSRELRVLGTGHSFSPVADTAGDLVSLAGLPKRVEIDGTSATVAAGLRYGEITGALHAAGLALPNLGSLPHISVAGACSTGTHGSGDGNPILAAAVSRLEIVTADGSLRTIHRGDPGFDGAVVALGLLGVVTAVTLDLQPAFDVRQWVYEGAVAWADLDEALAEAYSVSLFSWFTSAGADQIWVKQRTDRPDPPPRWLGAERAAGPRHMAPGENPAHCTEQGGVAGPWHARLPHFRLAFTPSSGEELQSEYFVPRPVAAAALAALAEIRARIAPVLITAEVRSVAADDQWLSPAHGRESVALHFTWVPDAAAVAPVLAEVEAVLAPFEPRSHWGKVFRAAPPLPRQASAVALAHDWDPAGTFQNAFTRLL